MSKIKLEIAGLKCDNPKCDYTDNTKYEEYVKNTNVLLKREQYWLNFFYIL